MNNLYIVWEDNHGNLAITNSYEKAIDFLFDEEWIPIPCNTTEAEYRFYLKNCLTIEEFNEKMENEIGISVVKGKNGIYYL